MMRYKILKFKNNEIIHSWPFMAPSLADAEKHYNTLLKDKEEEFDKLELVEVLTSKEKPEIFWHQANEKLLYLIPEEILDLCNETPYHQKHELEKELAKKGWYIIWTNKNKPISHYGISKEKRAEYFNLAELFN